KRDELFLAGHGLAVTLDQFRLVVPRLQMAASAGAEDDKDILRLGTEVGRARRMRMLWRPLGPNRRFVSAEEFLFRKHRDEHDAAQPCAAEAEEIAAIEQPPASVGGRGIKTHRRIRWR